MTVDLISVFKANDYFENIGLGYIKAFLEKNGFNVKIHTIITNQNLISQLNFNGRNPKLIGISIYMHTQDSSFFLAKEIKKLYPHTHITIGGPQVMGQTKELLTSHPYVDSACNGEGENVLLCLAHCLKCNIPLNQCDGITYRKNKKIIKNKNEIPINDLNSLPFPARDVYESSPNDYMYLVGGRGCLGHCTFCTDTQKESPLCDKVRIRSGKNLADEAEYLSKKYNIRRFKILDSTFEDPGFKGLNRAISFYNEIIKRNLNISFSINSRAELIRKYSYNYIALAKKAGLESVYLGVESGNSDDLKLYGKIASLDDIVAAVNILKRNNINIVFGFICFNPYTTFDKLRKNVEFLYNNSLPFNFSTLRTYLEVFPQATLSKKIIHDHLLYDNYKKGPLGTNFIFQNPKVAKLFEAIKTIHINENIARIDSHIDMDIIRLKRNFVLAEPISKIYNEILELRKDRTYYTYRFFLDCINIVDSDEDIYEFVLNNKFEQFDNKLIELYNLFKNLIIDSIN